LSRKKSTVTVVTPLCGGAYTCADADVAASKTRTAERKRRIMTAGSGSVVVRIAPQ
jgi:hypothetical protein